MHGKASNVTVRYLHFPGVDAGSNFHPKLAYGILYRGRASNSPSRSVKNREDTIARAVHLPPSELGNEAGHNLVVLGQETGPRRIANIRKPFRRAHDIREQHRRQHSLIKLTRDWARACDELLHQIEKLVSHRTDVDVDVGTFQFYLLARRQVVGHVGRVVCRRP